MNRNTKALIAIFLIFFLSLFAITTDVFSAGDNKSTEKQNRPADRSLKSLLMLEMPQGVILGRPTDTSITLNVYAQNDSEFYIEYGPNASKYGDKTSTYKLSANHAENITINGLKPNSRYYYRILTKNIKEGDFVASSQYSFHTCRAKGSDFCFIVQADSHLDAQSDVEVYKNTLAAELAQKPDFMIDLGDTFMVDKLAEKSDGQIRNRYLMQRGFFSLACHSVPLYLASGNHDGETGWDFNGRESKIALLASKNRTTYFPNPEPDLFYTGSNMIQGRTGLTANYYTWTWGDALFVVLDPYRYMIKKPGRAVDNWGWTLGDKQYKWFQDTLENSDAAFKFVFCHQLVGGKDSDGRGGAEFVKYYEMGGFNKDDTWGFDVKRPGWGKPIHRLMVDNKVTIFFHGHDHFFARQQVDGVIYQLVPQPSHADSKSPRYAESYGYTEGVIQPNSGFLEVIVEHSKLTVRHMQTAAETVTTNYSYSLSN